MKKLNKKIFIIVLSMFGMFALISADSQALTDDPCQTTSPKTQPQGNPECPGLDQVCCCRLPSGDLVFKQIGL